ncbi:MAG: hypothetical protein Q7S57_05080 [bacterium]|nr:hypothetical protein [bacterium]
MVSMERGPSIGASDNEEINSPEDDRVVRIKTDNGLFDLVYSDHTIANDPETMREADAILLEQRALFSNSGVEMYLDFIEKDEKGGRQYRAIVAEAKKTKKPIFMVDLPLTYKSQAINEEQLTAGLGSQLEALLGVVLTLSVGRDIVKQKMNRRQFLKVATKGLVATYFMTPIAERLIPSNADGSVSGESSLARKSERNLISFNDKAHPELNKDFTIELRNKVMAQKAETVAKSLTKAGVVNPVCSVYVGAKHFGMEQALKKTERQRMQEIRDYTKEDTSQLGKIARIDFGVAGDGKETVTISIFEDEAFR